MPNKDIFAKPGDNKRRTVVLTLTNNCNLKCKYCYEEHNDRKSAIMDFETAKEKITKYMEMDDGLDMVEIQFFGGEPFLAFPLIKKIVSWFHTKEWKKQHVFFIPTNVTLLDDEIEKWLIENKKDVKMGFSLDGTKTAHNLGRDNSYDRVVKNIPFFKEHFPEQIVKMTIYEETLPYIAESVIDLEEKGLLFAANVVFEDIWGTGEKKEKLLELYEDQLSQLVDYYAARPHLVPVTLVDRKIEYLADSKKKAKKNIKFCGGGVQTVGMDVQGNEYPCHRFIPSFNDSYEPPPGPVNERSQWEPDICNDCKLVDICPTCIAYNWQVNKDTSQRTTYHCESFKLEILATAKLQALRIKQQMDEEKSEKEKNVLRQKVAAIIELINEGI